MLSPVTVEQLDKIDDTITPERGYHFINCQADYTKNFSEEEITKIEKELEESLKEELTKEEKEVSESMEVTQGKLIIGMDINIEDEPDTDKGLVLKHRCGLKTVVDCLIFNPALRLLKQEMACEHHYEIYASQNEKHRSNAELILQKLHDRRSNSFGKSKTHDGDTSCKALIVLKPEHQSLNGR